MEHHLIYLQNVIKVVIVHLLYSNRHIGLFMTDS